jgi:dienelactone hydrolase
MTEILLLHHAQGRTAGVLGLADRLAAAGHTVHTPDLFDGRTFDSVEAGVAHARTLGDAVDDRADDAADALPPGLAYVGWSLGVMPAQRLAQQRPGARGLVCLEAFVPPAFFGGWPGVPAQIHGRADDPWFVEDLAAAREFVESTDAAELFVYPGDGHLFVDTSTTAYDAGLAAQVEERVLDFLAELG